MKDETIELYEQAVRGAQARLETARQMHAAGVEPEMRAGIGIEQAVERAAAGEDRAPEPPDTWRMRERLERKPANFSVEPPDTWQLNAKLKQQRGAR
jgi:hypothetical protein